MNTPSINHSHADLAACLADGIKKMAQLYEVRQLTATLIIRPEEISATKRLGS